VYETRAQLPEVTPRMPPISRPPTQICHRRFMERLLCTQLGGCVPRSTPGLRFISKSGVGFWRAQTSCSSRCCPILKNRWELFPSNSDEGPGIPTRGMQGLACARSKPATKRFVITVTRDSLTVPLNTLMTLYRDEQECRSAGGRDPNHRDCRYR
jgi:hypothetical protein